MTTAGVTRPGDSRRTSCAGHAGCPFTVRHRPAGSAHYSPGGPPDHVWGPQVPIPLSLTLSSLPSTHVAGYVTTRERARGMSCHRLWTVGRMLWITGALRACRPVVSPGWATVRAMTTGHPQSQLMTPRAVRDLLAVSATTVRNLRKTGRLTAVRTDGGHYRYRDDSPAIVAVLSQLGADS